MTQPSQSKGATRPNTRSKNNERWIGLLVLVGTITFIVAFFYVLGVFS
jgi:hypothetical protein